jgi:hypothetical protein
MNNYKFTSKHYSILIDKLPIYVLPIYVYITTFLIYNCVGTWLDAKNQLIKYRENKLDIYEKNQIRDEWTAVKYGANINFLGRLFNSLSWPVKIVTNFIPFMVLQFNKSHSITNKNKDKDKEN